MDHSQDILRIFGNHIKFHSWGCMVADRIIQLLIETKFPPHKFSKEEKQSGCTNYLFDEGVSFDAKHLIALAGCNLTIS